MNLRIQNKIAIANSSWRSARDGIGFVDPEALRMKRAHALGYMIQAFAMFIANMPAVAVEELAA